MLQYLYNILLLYPFSEWTGFDFYKRINIEKTRSGTVQYEKCWWRQGERNGGKNLLLSPLADPPYPISIHRAMPPPPRRSPQSWYVLSNAAHSKLSVNHPECTRFSIFESYDDHHRRVVCLYTYTSRPHSSLSGGGGGRRGGKGVICEDNQSTIQKV